jgi:hypothetical protein
MFNLDIVSLANKNVLTRFLVPKAVRVGQMVENVSPELALVGGIVSGAVAAVKFAQAYKEHEEVFGDLNEYIQIARDTLDQTKEQHANGEESSITVQQASVGLARVYGAYAVETVKHYGPALAWTGVSLYLLTTSHGIMRGRNKMLLASAKALEIGFSEYRKRVQAEHGEEADRRYLHGFREETVTEQVVDDDGKTKKVKSTRNRQSDDPTLLYGRTFDETNRQWEVDRDLNHFKISSVESYMNDKLRISRVILLNDVYDALGFPRSPEGAVVGWALDGPGDDFIDFGLDAYENHPSENQFFLDFNVNGVVFEYLGK